MSNDCCDYGCTGKGFNCPARECSQVKGRDIEAEHWKFTGKQLPPPDTEVRDKAVSFIGFVLAMCVLWAGVSVIASLLERI